MLLAIALFVLQVPGSAVDRQAVEAAQVARQTVSASDTGAAVIRLPEAASSRLVKAEMAEASVPAPTLSAYVTPQAPARKELPQPNRKAWLTLAIVQHGAATFDAWTTRHRIEEGRYRETNPLLRPFAGNASLYLAIQAVPLGTDLTARWMQTARNPHLRRLWWLPQVAQAGTSIAFGISNLRK